VLEVFERPVTWRQAEQVVAHLAMDKHTRLVLLRGAQSERARGVGGAQLKRVQLLSTRHISIHPTSHAIGLGEEPPLVYHSELHAAKAHCLLDFEIAYEQNNSGP
jgi:hypothetical protein